MATVRRSRFLTWTMRAMVFLFIILVLSFARNSGLSWLSFESVTTGMLSVIITRLLEVDIRLISVEESFEDEEDEDEE